MCTFREKKGTLKAQKIILVDAKSHLDLNILSKIPETIIPSNFSSPENLRSIRTKPVRMMVSI